MIDINKLRRLAQEATHPTTKGRWMRLFGERTVYDRMEDGCRGIPIVATDHPPAKQEAAYLDFIAAANPATINDLLGRLEAAERSDAESIAMYRKARDERDALRTNLDDHRALVFDLRKEVERLRAKLEAAEKSDAESLAMYRRARDERDALRAAVRHEADCVEAAKAEIDALRAKIAEMERQEPVAWRWELKAGQYTYIDKPEHAGKNARIVPLYLLPGTKGQEPTRDWWDCLIADISAIDCMYRGSPTYTHNAYWMQEHVVQMLEKRRDALPGVKGEDK